MPTMLTTDTLVPERLAVQALAALPGIRHGFFTRRGGVSAGPFAGLNCGLGSGDDIRRVLDNRARVAASLRVGRERLVSPRQVHGNSVVVAREPWAPGADPEADAIVTKMRGLAIGVGTADCAPVLFADAAAGVVGAAHAGWGGALKGVVEATVAAMIAEGARTDRIVAGIGPVIAKASYEVGPEFRDRFTAADAGNDRFFGRSERADHWRFDLPAYVEARLRALGLAAIGTLRGLDTYADEARFFSFRRSTHRGEKEYGRMISAVVIV